MELNVTKDLFQTRLQQFTGNAQALEKRQEPIRDLRKHIAQADPSLLKEIDQHFKECHDLEKDLQEFESAPKEWEKEGKSQILFTQDWAKSFNHIPFVLPTAAIFKIYIFPFFAVVLPLLAWILPYVIIRIFFGMPIPFEQYKNMMMNMWLGGKPWDSLDFWGQLRVVFQSAWTLFGIFQGMYQPIQQAMHTKAIDDTIVKHGTLFQIFITKVNRLFELLGTLNGKKITSPFLKEIPLDEPRQTYAYVREYPSDVKWIWQKLGEEELTWRLANAEGLTFAAFRKSQPVSLSLKGFFDPAIPVEERVSSDIKLAEKTRHAILTGPNKGGKSSNLRALCLNVWLAQTFGMVFAEEASLTPFAWIRSGLRLADAPGSESLFEREVHFATKTLRMAASGRPGIVLYDECFHSTNPPDGEKTSRIFLSNLWSQQNVVSLVSTHVFSLVETAPEQIQRLCVPAEQTPTSILYSYRLAPGICKVSSVEEIYKKFGFPSAAKTARDSGLL